MKLRLFRRKWLFVTSAALVIGLLLIVVNLAWPDAFRVFVAIGGLVGALMVIYEVTLTKRLAKAEFIRDLQSGFTLDPNINGLWGKLLKKEKITSEDRPLVSSYLTFFETLHLLIEKGTLEISLVDELFRNRFFTAVGDQGLLETALIRNRGSFTNIHNLIETWNNYLIEKHIHSHPGYYSYIRALLSAKGYETKVLGPTDLPDLLSLQGEVLAGLGNAPWLRANSEEMFADCLANQMCLGVRHQGRLIGAAILYDGHRGEENIRGYFTDDPAALDKSINLKLVLTASDHRRNGLSRTIVELLEPEAIKLGKSEILCTIHPQNAPSRKLFQRLGYEKIGRFKTSYGIRDVFARSLTDPELEWPR